MMSKTVAEQFSVWLTQRGYTAVMHPESPDKDKWIIDYWKDDKPARHMRGSTRVDDLSWIGEPHA
jgi:hypothetical protein